VLNVHAVLGIQRLFASEDFSNANLIERFIFTLSPIGLLKTGIHLGSVDK
jgi:hypothetical protein